MSEKLEEHLENIQLSMIYEHPVRWREGCRPTPSTERRKFDDGFYFSLMLDPNLKTLCKDIYRRLINIGAEVIIVSSNIPARSNGELWQKQKMPEDPRTSVTFRYGKMKHIIHCDKYNHPILNLKGLVEIVSCLELMSDYLCSSHMSDSPIFEEIIRNFQVGE